MSLKEMEIAPGAIVFLKKDIMTVDSQGEETVLVPWGSWGLINASSINNSSNSNDGIRQVVNVLFDNSLKFLQVHMDMLTTDAVINPSIKYDMDVIFSHMLFLEKMNRMNVSYNAISITEIRHRLKANDPSRDLLMRHLMSIYITSIQVNNGLIKPENVDWKSIEDTYYDDLILLGVTTSDLKQLHHDIIAEFKEIENSRKSWGLREHQDGTAFESSLSLNPLDDQEVF